MVDEKRQVIVHAQAFGTGEDGRLAGEMLRGAEQNLTAVGWKKPLKEKVISADSGYYSVENLEACRDLEVDAYIPDPQFRKRDPRFEDARRHRRSVDKRHQRYTPKKRWFTPEDFRLDERTGKLICPAGQGLYVKNRNFEIRGHRAIAYQGTKRGICQISLR